MGQALKIENTLPEMNDIKSLALTALQIEEKKLDKSQFFEVACGETILGFIEQNELKKFLEKNPNQYTDIFVRKFGQETWMTSTSHPFFQRRKPTLVRENEIDPNARFFYMREAHKVGPYTLPELKAKIEKKEILVTELIVSEKGGPWFKLFELTSFNRRVVTTAHHLPTCPGPDFFEQHNKKQAPPKFEEKNAMAGLAYIGHLKNGKIEEKEDVIKSDENGPLGEESFVRKIKTQMFYKKLVMISLTVITLILGASFFILKWKASQSNENVQATSEKTVDAPMLTPLEKINTIRQRARPVRENPIARKPASIRDSQIYKNQREELLNYDKGQNPIESDPVRDQLSQETINPAPILNPEPAAEEAQNWASPENIKPANPGESPFTEEATN